VRRTQPKETENTEQLGHPTIDPAGQTMNKTLPKEPNTCGETVTISQHCNLQQPRWWLFLPSYEIVVVARSLYATPRYVLDHEVPYKTAVGGQMALPYRIHFLAHIFFCYLS
jgi:hypothetical protein